MLMQIIRICHLKAGMTTRGSRISPAKGCEQGYSALASQALRGGFHEQ
jgi:hypothetical protein